jgi:hypothetical protein
MEQMKKISEEEKKLHILLLTKLMEGCYIDKLTGQFYCKKCKCVVNIDWGNHIAYCVAAGKFCVCVNKEDIT